MNVIFRRSFLKDLKKIRQQALRREIEAVIMQLENAHTWTEIPTIKHLTSAGPYYRIRIGDYRMGITISEETVTIVRFLHRRDIYRYFP